MPVSRSARGFVGRARALQLVEEPQPLLRERQRDPSGAGVRQSAPGRPSRAAVQPARQTGHGRRLEQAADRHLHAEHRADAADQPASPAASGRRGRRSLSSMPTAVDAEHLGEEPRTAAPRAASRGARPRAGAAHVRRGQRARGRACRSGSAAARRARTTADGHHVVGQRAAQRARAAPRGRASASASPARRRRRAACRPARSSRTTTAACAHAGVARAAPPRSRRARSGSRGS